MTLHFRQANLLNFDWTVQLYLFAAVRD
jgi:hypothetical protein